jgi:hypothetical protein
MAARQPAEPPADALECGESSSIRRRPCAVDRRNRQVEGVDDRASGAGVRVHSLPTKPGDIEDDGQFHYAVVLPSAASESGKPSAEVKRLIDVKSATDTPRVYRNAVLLLAPSKDGLAAADARVRD